MSLITLSCTSLISISSFGKWAEEGKVSEYNVVLQMLGLGFLFIVLLVLFFTNCIFFFFFLVLSYGIIFFFFVYSFVLTGVCLGNMCCKNWKGRIREYFIMFSLVCTGFGCICLACSPLQGNAGVRCWTKLSQADFGVRDDTIEVCSCCIWVSVT